MWAKIRRVLMILLAAVFLFCGGTVAVVQHQYNVSKRLYRNASSTFTEVQTQTPPEKVKDEKGVEIPVGELAPIKVDFEALQKVNPDIIGWIYCPDTVIDYPVLHGEDNDTYLHHSFDRTYNASGSIFEDAYDLRGFLDSNFVLYGHHMANGAMFATLDHWQREEYFDEHPVMWLLTPTQDYRVELFSAYHTSAYSDVYTIYRAPSPEFTEYLAKVQGYSYVKRDNVTLDPNARYALLSTCAYIFDDARSVLHGKLVPLDSAGGTPLRMMTVSEEQAAEAAKNEEKTGTDGEIRRPDNTERDPGTLPVEMLNPSPSPSPETQETP